jgi:hypothetical protein
MVMKNDGDVSTDIDADEAIAACFYLGYPWRLDKNIIHIMELEEVCARLGLDEDYVDKVMENILINHYLGLFNHSSA